MRKNPSQARQYALQGFLLGLLPASLWSVYAENPFLPGKSGILTSFLAGTLLLAGCGLLFRNRKKGGLLISAGILLNLFLLFFDFLSNPLLTLFCLLLTAGAFYYLLTARLFAALQTTAELQLERVIGCSSAGVVLSLTAPLFTEEIKFLSLITSVNLFLLLFLIWKYCKLKEYFQHPKSLSLLLFLTIAGIGFLSWRGGVILTAFLTTPAILYFSLRHKHTNWKYLELIIAHPARCLFLTFLGLCIGGTLLLRTPWAMTGELSLSAAAFTSVSAVCVTGLTVIDISRELTITGQYFLLLLIQLGGLGIMTLTTLALHTIGKLSLSGEQLITELTQSGEKDVFESLRLILSFTFIAELAGALLLTGGFYLSDGEFLPALHKGIFTSISAFCNAGFFPGAESLMPYANSKWILTVTALEIIIGGMAPVVIWSLLKVRRYRQLPMVSKIILGTTGILVSGGTFLLLLFEWNGIFAGLPWHDKLFNGFFQSVTLRTAGFNSVPFSSLGIPAYFVMLIWMFIGGSPGGTAGGIKTTTLAVIAFTFRTAIRNEETVTAGNYRIPLRTLVQSVAILTAAATVLVLIVMMLVMTQSQEAGKLLFEAVSALATVGLSLDCTMGLDPIGRTIIMGAMFIGRIGPLTLFCILSESGKSTQAGHPAIKIPLG